MLQVCANFNHSSSQLNVALQLLDEINHKLKKIIFVKIIYIFINNSTYSKSLTVNLMILLNIFHIQSGRSSIIFYNEIVSFDYLVSHLIIIIFTTNIHKFF